MKKLRKGLISCVLILSIVAGDLCLFGDKIKAVGWMWDSTGMGTFDNAGAIEGWNETEGGWVYFENGRLQFNRWIEWNDDLYYVNQLGIMQRSKVVEKDGKKVLLKDSGRMLKSGWTTLANGSSYYAKEDGILMESGDALINGKVYTFSRNGEWITERDFHGNGIKLHKEGNVSDSIMKRYADDLAKIPSLFADKIVNVTVTSRNLNETFWTQNVGTIVGLQSYGEIWLNASIYVHDTVLHESIHAYDSKYDGPNTEAPLSRTPEFINAYNADFDSIPFQEDNVKCVEEGFVAMMMLYLKDEVTCRQKMPNMTVFIQQHFDERQNETLTIK